VNAKPHAFVGFDALKQAVSMVQVLDRYSLTGRLHRSGDNLSGPCPIHADHNKTQFRVSMSKNCWICFGDCTCGGSIIDFVSRMESQFGFRVHLYQIQAPESIRLELVRAADQQAFALEVANARAYKFRENTTVQSNSTNPKHCFFLFLFLFSAFPSISAFSCSNSSCSLCGQTFMPISFAHHPTEELVNKPKITPARRIFATSLSVPLKCQPRQRLLYYYIEKSIIFAKIFRL